MGVLERVRVDQREGADAGVEHRGHVGAVRFEAEDRHVPCGEMLEDVAAAPRPISSSR